MFTIKKRHRILLFFFGAVLLLLWANQPQTSETPPQDTPALTQVTGEVMIIHSDNEAFTEAGTQAFLFDGQELYQLDSPLPMLTPWNGQHVQITGSNLIDFDVKNDPLTNDFNIIQVADIQGITRDAPQAAVTGNEKWVNIACRFGDMTDETPRPREYFDDIMQNIAPGMDHYWRQSSSGQVDIEGSAAYGWYDLPRNKSLYMRLPTPVALRTLLQDCVDLAVEQDGLDLTRYGGINIMLNDKFGCCAWGGRMAVSTENGSKTFRTTWLPPWAFNSLHVIAHEMGHGWGLPHSSGPYGKVYDSAWDVMSGGTRMLDFCRVGSEGLGCFQVGTIGYHLDMLGWLPQDRVQTVAPGDSQMFILDALTTARSTSNTLLVKVPVGSASARTFYTAEVRTLTGYDRNVPGEAVVLHEVRTGRSSPALVVDADNNGDPNDEGAMWFPGETFESNDITIEVLQRIGTTYVVRVTNNS